MGTEYKDRQRMMRPSDKCVGKKMKRRMVEQLGGSAAFYRARARTLPDQEGAKLSGAGRSTEIIIVSRKQFLVSQE